MWGPHQISFITYYMVAPPDQFLFILCESPIRSVSSHTMWGALGSISLQTVMGAPTRSGSSHTLWGPLRSVSSHNIRGPFRLFPHNMGVPHRSVSSHTTWGPPSAQFLHTLYGGPLRSVSSHTT